MSALEPLQVLVEAYRARKSGPILGRVVSVFTDVQSFPNCPGVSVRTQVQGLTYDDLAEIRRQIDAVLAEIRRDRELQDERERAKQE